MTQATLYDRLYRNPCGTAYRIQSRDFPILGYALRKNLVTTCFVQPSINKDSRNWSRQCIPCQRCKVTRHVSLPTGTFEVLTGRIEHIHIDIFVMQYSQGYRYCRWRHSTTNTVTRHLLIPDNDSAVVSALGYKSSGPGFRSRRP